MFEKAQAAMRYNTLIAGERKARENMWKEWWVPTSARTTRENPEGIDSSSWTGGYHG